MNHGKVPIADYNKERSRFFSEYGFQSFPEFESVKRYAPNPEDWDIYSEVMMAHQRGGMHALRHFSTIELEICLLLKAGISVTGIATLTGRTKSTITSARKKMYEKVNRTKGKPEQWDEFIASL